MCSQLGRLQSRQTIDVWRDGQCQATRLEWAQSFRYFELTNHNLLERCSTWEAYSAPASLQIVLISCNLNIHRTVFTTARHVLLSWITFIQSTPSSLFQIHFNIIHPYAPWHSKWVGLPGSSLYAAVLLIYMPHPPPPPWFDHPYNVGWGVQIISSPCSPPPLASCLFVSSHDERSQVSHPYKTTGKMAALYT